MRLSTAASWAALPLLLVPSAQAAPARSFAGSRAEGQTAVVLDSGFTQKFYGHTGGSSLTYGVLLVNKSTTEDAFAVTVKVTAIGRNGKALPYATDTKKITLIPAGVKFAVGDRLLCCEGQTRVARLRITTRVGRTRPKGAVLPPLSHLHFYPSYHEITGRFTNPYAATMSIYDVHYSYVIYDKQGKLVTGGSDDGDAVDSGETIAPGAKAPFTLIATEGPDNASLSRISIDPGYLPRGGIPRR
jgi:hypothetical protein